MRILKRTRIIRDGDSTPYLVRWDIFECFLFSIKLHHILQSDHDCPHDHPWAFVSFILSGGYWEVTPLRRPSGWGGRLALDNEQRKWYGPGCILYRPSNWIHRLELKNKRVPYLGRFATVERSMKATTLVITFLKHRKWGFWTPRGFKTEGQYHAQNRCE